jgi:hypothetical protein
MPDPDKHSRRVPAQPCEELVLAAVDRAGRHHRAGDTPAVPVWTILEHLGVARRSAEARSVRSQLDALRAAGLLECSRRHGVTTWQLAVEGRRRLRRALRAGRTEALPESPQHRAWRNARTTAAQEIERFCTELREQLSAATLLLEADPPPRSDAWLELAEVLSRACRLVGSASHCLYEWSEPDDALADVDEGIDPGDEQRSRDELARLRALRAGRRNIALWSHARGR